MAKTVLTMALAALVGCTAPGPSAAADVPGHHASRVTDGPVPDAHATRGPASLRDAMMAGHNAARSAVGVAPLVWDTTLADHAAAYARTLAQSGRFEHAVQPQGPGREGENLFTGTRNAYRYTEMVQFWVDERRLFVNRPTPGFSTSGNWADVGHYTQMIWGTTRRFGCALASNARDDYLVCRYDPPGNVYGQRAF